MSGLERELKQEQMTQNFESPCASLDFHVLWNVWSHSSHLMKAIVFQMQPGFFENWRRLDSRFQMYVCWLLVCFRLKARLKCWHPFLFFLRRGGWNEWGGPGTGEGSAGCFYLNIHTKNNLWEATSKNDPDDKMAFRLPVILKCNGNIWSAIVWGCPGTG